MAGSSLDGNSADASVDRVVVGEPRQDHRDRDRELAGAPGAAHAQRQPAQRGEDEVEGHLDRERPQGRVELEQPSRR